MGTNAPDPNLVCLSLPWGEDFQLMPNGSLALVAGVGRLQQRIVRRFFTCSERVTNEGMYIPPDYLFDPDYGVGASSLVGQKISNQLANILQQKILAAAMVDEGWTARKLQS